MPVGRQNPGTCQAFRSPWRRASGSMAALVCAVLLLEFFPSRAFGYGDPWTVGRQPVFNLEIARGRSYLVGRTSIYVHNASRSWGGFPGEVLTEGLPGLANQIGRTLSDIPKYEKLAILWSNLKL